MHMRKSVITVYMLLLFVISLSSEVFAEPRPIKARQQSLNLEFQVYRTTDMPPNWFKTYDGFYVTKRIDNNWVYGQHTMAGMKMTDIIVGSDDPATVPELNESYTYVSAGTRPVYMPPLPPEMRAQQITAEISPSESQLPYTPTLQTQETTSPRETASALNHDISRTVDTVEEIRNITPLQIPINTPVAEVPINTPATDYTAEHIALGTAENATQANTQKTAEPNIPNISTPLFSENISQDWLASISYKRRYTS